VLCIALDRTIELLNWTERTETESTDFFRFKLSDSLSKPERTKPGTSKLLHCTNPEPKPNSSLVPNHIAIPNPHSLFNPKPILNPTLFLTLFLTLSLDHCFLVLSFPVMTFPVLSGHLT